MEALDAFDADLSDVSVPGMDADASPATEDTAAPETVEAADSTDAVSPADPAKQAAVEAVVAQTADATKAADPAKPAAKQLTFTADGKPIALTDAAETEWKIDGKSEKVKLKDLLDNYAGKVAYDRKFQELSQQRKGFQEESSAFQASRERQKSLISDMHKAAGEGRVFDAVANMLEMTGLDKQIDPRQYIGQLREALTKQAETRRGMSEEQRQVQDLKEEQEYLRAQNSRVVAQREREQAEKAFHERVNKAIDTAKSTPEEFVQTREWLLGQFKEHKYDLKDLTPEYIAGHIRDVRDYKTAKEAMESVDPELTKNTSLWEQTVLLMRANPSWTAEDVRQIFQKAVGDKRSKAVSAKLAKAPVATAAKAAVKSKAAPAKPAPDDYSKFTADDLAW